MLLYLCGVFRFKGHTKRTRRTMFYRNEAFYILIQKLLKGNTALSISTTAGECQFTQWKKKGRGNLLEEMVYPCGSNLTWETGGGHGSPICWGCHGDRGWQRILVFFWFNQGYYPPSDINTKGLSHVSMEWSPERTISLALRLVLITLMGEGRASSCQWGCFPFFPQLQGQWAVLTPFFP